MAEDRSQELTLAGHPERTLEGSAASTSPGEPEPLAPGDTLGRYVVLHRVGAGAMGVVYAAFDPELDRKVALKILSPRQRGHDESAGRQRLQREAQALARLHHPNVVAVHDVGTHQDRVYVAMEFVEGETLTAWRRRAAPRRREILAMFRQAGQGLVAAHKAGLIHRDFKPDNVIVGTDGVVRVLDFGLARADDTDPLSQPNDELMQSAVAAAIDESPGRSAGGSLASDLTRTGGVLGTPAYMAPEQHLGLPADARSDQFSFCVALYEGLYDQRPFSGDSPAAIAFSVTQGKVGDGGKASVPAWVRRVLLQGLRANPGDRFPDMRSLLMALDSDPAIVRRKVAAGVGVAALAGVAGFGLWGQVSEPSICADVDAPIHEVWNPAVQGKIAEAFQATGLPYATASGKAVAKDLQGWTTRWASGRREACEATHDRGEQSADLLDRRMICLDRQLGEATALVEKLSFADASAVEKAVVAARDLPDPALCADAHALLQLRPPLSGVAAAEGQAIDLLLAEGNAALLTADFEGAKAKVDQVTPRVEALADPGTTARFSKLRSKLAAERGDSDEQVRHLEAMFVAADEAGEDRVRIAAAIRLAAVVGYEQSQAQAGTRWLKLGRGALVRFGESAELEAELLVAEGVILMRAGEYEQAIKILEQGVAQLTEVFPDDAHRVSYSRQRLALAYRERGRLDDAAKIQRELLALYEKQFGPDHPLVALALSSLASTLYSQGDYATAAKTYKQAMAIRIAALGEDNEQVALLENNYAATVLNLGRYEEAEAIHRKVLARNEQRHGPNDPRLTPSLENLGNVLTSQRRFEEAVGFFRRSLQIRKTVHDADHPSVAMSEMNLGVALYQLGNYAEARRLHEHTRAVWTEKLGPDHVDLGLVETNLGDLAVAERKWRPAVAHFDRALKLFEPTFGTDHPELGWPLVGQGLAYLGLQDREEAARVLERAARLREGQRLPDGELARMNWALVRAIEDEDPQRANALAKAAVVDAEKGDPKIAEALQSWLASDAVARR